MSYDPLIEAVKAELQNHSQVKLDQPNHDTLLINCDKEDGINITISSSSREYTLYLNKFHWHFDKTEDETNQIIDIVVATIVGNTRLLEFSKNGHPYKWKLELLGADKEWKYFGTSTIFNVDFWIKSEVKYFQNNPSIIE